MMLRKILRYVLVALVVLGAVGGIGTLFGKRAVAASVAQQLPNYSAEKANTAAFASTYLTISQTGDPTVRSQALQNFAGNNSWIGSDPAVTAIPKKAISQRVLKVLPEDPVVIDSSHMAVPVLVEIQISNSANPTWLQLNVPVGHDDTGINVYTAPAIVRPFGPLGQVQDKAWSQSVAASNVTVEIQANLYEFLSAVPDNTIWIMWAVRHKIA